VKVSELIELLHLKADPDAEVLVWDENAANYLPVTGMHYFTGSSGWRPLVAKKIVTLHSDVET
jgi:hypothetical protein